ncbi:MAG: MBL fold metallo-hydrolase [Bacteroidetes bacterium]|nr:MAG: MBL fold metallo-hydrolase [Bacteroidota bacterium]
MSFKIKQFTFNPFQENTYLLYHKSGEALIIDPGCYERHEKKELEDFLEQENLELKALLNTHCHIDHVLGNSFVKERFQVPFYMHREDLETLRSVSSYAHMYGFPGYEPSPEPDHFLEDGQLLEIGPFRLKVIFGPGHAPGHVAFYSEEQAVLIGGDILFQGSFGRVDLPGGSLEVLKKTIFERIFTLPDETLVYPGHGPETSIGQERQTNYILQF